MHFYGEISQLAILELSPNMHFSLSIVDVYGSCHVLKSNLSSKVDFRTIFCSSDKCASQRV